MRAVSSGTGGTGCGRRSDMGDLWTRKPSNAMAPHKAADFANGVRSLSGRCQYSEYIPVWLGTQAAGERVFSQDSSTGLTSKIQYASRLRRRDTSHACVTVGHT